MSEDMLKLGFDVESRKIRTATDDVGKFGRAGTLAGTASKKATDKMKTGYNGVALAAGAALSAMLGIRTAIRTIAEFESSVSRMGAISGATTAQLERMRDVAKDLGSTTEFTATQAADGLTFLAMAGFRAAEAISAIPAVLDLATASGMGLAQAADTASNIMSGFGIAAENASNVTDILAAASSRANTSVTQLGGAMSTVAPIAKALNISLADTAAAIGVMSDAGIQGERAGTAMRGVLASLAGPTTQAVEVLTKLGLTIRDIDPATNSLSTVMGRLGEAGLSTADAMTVFGREAASGALVLIDGAQRLGEFGDELRNVDGAAADMAGTIRDNLGGDIKGLQSAVSGLILALGDAGLTAVLRGVVQTITFVTRAVSGLIEGFNSLTGWIYKIVTGNQRLDESYDEVTAAVSAQELATGQLKVAMADGSVITLESARAVQEDTLARMENIEVIRQQNREKIMASDDFRELTRQAMLATAQIETWKASYQGGGDFAPIAHEAAEGLRAMQEEFVSARIAQAELLAEAEFGTDTYAALVAKISETDNAIAAAERAAAFLAAQILRADGAADELASSAGSIDFSAAISGAYSLGNNLFRALGAAQAIAGEMAAASGADGRMARARLNTVGDPVGRAGAVAVQDFREDFGDGGYGLITGGRAGELAQAESQIRSAAEAAAQLEIDVTAADAAFGALTTSADSAGGATSGAADAMQDQISALEDAFNPLRAFNREMAKLDELKLQGLSDGAYAAAVEDLRDQLEQATPEVSKFTQMFKDGMGDAVDYTVDGWRDGFAGLLDIVKNTIMQAIKFAIANPIKLALGLGGGGAAGALAGGAGGGGILGNIGLGGGIAGSFMSGGAGLITSMMGGGGLASAGTYMTSILGGATSSMAGFAAAAGAVALPLLAVAGVFSFFKKKTKELDAGMRLTITGMDTLVETFSKIETKRFWGLSKKVSTAYDEAASNLADPLSQIVNDLQTSVLNMAGSLGVGADVYRDFAHEIKLSTKGMSDEDAQRAVSEALQGVGDAFAAMTPQLAQFAREGEESGATLTRIVRDLGSVNQMMDTLGHTLQEVSVIGAGTTSDWVAMFGGIDAMNTATTEFFTGFVPNAERFATASRQIEAQFAALNIAMPKSRTEFRNLVEGLDLTTSSGRQMYAELVSMSGALNEVLPAVANFSAAVANIAGSIATEIDAMIGDTSNAMSANEQAASLWYRTATTLREFIADLRGTSSDLTSATQARAFSEARFQALLASAIAGDNEAASNLSGAASTLLRNTRATATSAIEVARAEARVINDLQLVSGVSDVEGARHDVIAGLLGQQVELLSTVRDAINNGDPLSPTDIDGLNGQLGALESAIAAAEMINYAFLKERLSVTVDLLATANLPADVRRLLANAQTGIEGTIDFIVRTDLAPDQKWLALTGSSEHIKTLKFIVDNSQWSKAAQNVALGAAGTYQKTVRFLAKNTMSADLTGLALSDADTLLKSIKFTAQALPADVRAIVFNQIAPLQKRINFMLGDTIPDDMQSLALDDADTFKRVIDLVAGQVLPTQIQALALSAPTAFARTLNILAGSAVSSTHTALALDAAKAFTRTINLHAGSEVSATTARLALDTVGQLDRTINLIAKSDLSDDETRIALAGSSELSRVVNVTLNKTSLNSDALRLALGNLGTYGVAVEASLDASADIRKIVFGDAGSYAAMIEATIESDSLSDDARRILLDQQGDYAANIIGTLHSGLSDPIKELMLNANTAAIRSITVVGLFPQSLTEEQRAMMLAQAEAINKTITGTLNLVGFGPDKLDMLRAENQTISKGVQGHLALMSFGPDKLAMLRAESQTISKGMQGHISLMGPDSDKVAMLRAQTGTITKTMSGDVDLSKLTDTQKRFMSAINGSASGQITLGGSFTFDPASGFSTWFGDATKTNITAPMMSLRSSLDALTDLMRREERAASLNNFASKLVGAGKGQFIATDPQIRQAAGIAGVDATGTAEQVAARVASFSGSDAIERIGVHSQSMMDFLKSQVGAAGLQVNPTEYRKVFPLLSESLEPDPQRHFELYTRDSGAAVARLTPRLFDWSSIGLNLPAFADGGMHDGGLRMVGEYGPELEATGASRIYSAQQTRQMLGGSANDNSVVIELRALHTEVAMLREEQRQLGIQTVTNTKRTSDTLRKADDTGWLVRT
jgi:TP901 family phage tail tape measure protein